MYMYVQDLKTVSRSQVPVVVFFIFYILCILIVFK